MGLAGTMGDGVKLMWRKPYLALNLMRGIFPCFLCMQVSLWVFSVTCIYIHEYIHIYVYIYIHVYIYICVCIYVHIYIHICVCIYIYVYIYTCIFAYTYTCKRKEMRTPYRLNHYNIIWMYGGLFFDI